MALSREAVQNDSGTIVPATAQASDLERAFNAIKNKRRDLDVLFSYYDGPQPLKYSTEKLAELFGDIKAHFEQNWMSVVVDATTDRLQLNGFTTKDKDDGADETFKALFDRLHIDIIADDAHQASCISSQAYVIVWKDADGKTDLYYNDPRLCHVFYDDASPRVKRFAAKWFKRGDGKQEITLYYTDRLEHWTSPKQQQGQTGLDKASSFTLESAEANTFGVIPVFELKSPGEIFKVLSSQDAVNKLFADMMTAAEFGAMRQRWIISNADVGSLKNSPNEIWQIPAGDGAGQQSSVGQFEATELNNFSMEMEKIANHIFVNTRTPKHYLMATGSNVSGEALLAMEAPLNKKCRKRQNVFASQWQDIAAFMAQLEGLDVAPDNIACVWERIESVQPVTEAQARSTNVQAGIPIELQLKKEGWSDDELADLKKQKQAEAKQKADNLLQRVNSVRQNMNGGGDNGRQPNPAG